MKTFLASTLLLAVSLISPAYAGETSAPEPTRIVVECEDMHGVKQDAFGPGPGWQVGRWGQDLYQNMNFGGVWASRLRMAMSDATDSKAEAFSIIDVPADGKYKVWVKYECPPHFNYAFGIRIAPVAAADKPAFERIYGLIDSPKHFCFNDKPKTGSLFWSWGIDHDAAEGYEATLAKGQYRLTLYKTASPAPAAARSVDAILITSDLAEVSAPKYPRYPLLDELRRANHVYFRFRNKAAVPVKVAWNHWGHRPPDYYQAIYRELVRYYDANGKALPTPEKNRGDWPEPIAPGQASVWHDLGPTMNTESNSPFTFTAAAVDSKVKGEASQPLGVDIALAPDANRIVKSFELDAGEPALTVLVQPDLHREEGVAHTRKIIDIYREVAAQLNSEPRVGPLPKKLKLFANTGTPYSHPLGFGFEAAQEFRYALGVNVYKANSFSKEYLDAVRKYWEPKGGIIERSLSHHHSQKPAEIVAKLQKEGIADSFYYLSFGDEIGLPAIDVGDQEKIARFREYVKAEGETPASLGVADWEQVKPLKALSAEVAVQIGVLPKDTPKNADLGAKLKRLYWYSVRFRSAEGIRSFAEKTRELRAALGNQVHTTANLGGMHPFYWMHQNSFIDAFKHHAMTLAWSEDYTYCQPEASRLVVDFEAAYLRKGASYHDTPTMFYCMPHYPGNSPQHLLHNVVLLWGQDIKDLDWFDASPDAFSTENYISFRGGLPTWKTLRTVSGMAGLIENDLLPARHHPTPIAMLLSESSDVWELGGGSQGDVKPGSEATNVSQEERKNTWYALRLAGYRVDMLTEDDVKEGLLNKYRVVYLCGQNLERKAASAIKQWVEQGGILFGTAGAARKDEFDEPLVTLDEVFGRGPAKSYDRYRGPLRPKIELLFERAKDQLVAGANVTDVLCSKETFQPAQGAEVLATYKSDNSPAWIRQGTGKGTAYYTGTLPAQAFIKRALPVVPMGKGGNESNFSHFEPIDFDKVAHEIVLRPVTDAKIQPDVTANGRSVVTSRLTAASATVIPISNLAEQHHGKLSDVEVKVRGLPKAPQRVWSCFHPKGIPFKQSGADVVITLPALQTADVIVISH